MALASPARTCGARRVAVGERGAERVIDRCLQLFGGYGYMNEYPICRAFADARVQTVYGGTSKIIKMIIGRDLTRIR
jgi:long-chain-acyl-CoA dehydrogenase